MDDEHQASKKVENDQHGRGCTIAILVFSAGSVGVVLGAVVAAYWASHTTRGKDAIFDPLMWALPLGAIVGAIGSASLTAAYLYLASRRR